jgi:hypothetical protein
MSSSLNLRIADFGAVRPGRQVADRRRALLLALGAGPLLSLPAAANTGAEAIAGLRRWGRGEFRRFGFLVYEATLWAGDDPQRPPLALRLDYRRHVEGRAIAEASVREIRRFVRDEDALQRWGGQMLRIFPDVKPGDHIVGVYRSDGARFYQDERLIGTIDAPGFADAFFAIWLDPRTSAPELRAALLRRSEA